MADNGKPGGNLLGIADEGSKIVGWVWGGWEDAKQCSLQNTNGVWEGCSPGTNTVPLLLQQQETRTVVERAGEKQLRLVAKHAVENEAVSSSSVSQDKTNFSFDIQWLTVQFKWHVAVSCEMVRVGLPSCTLLLQRSLLLHFAAGHAWLISIGCLAESRPLLTTFASMAFSLSVLLNLLAFMTVALAETSDPSYDHVTFSPSELSVCFFAHCYFSLCCYGCCCCCFSFHISLFILMLISDLYCHSKM